MSLPTLVLSLSLFWLSLHGLYAYARRVTPRPFSARAFSLSSSGAPTWLSKSLWLSQVLSSTQISLKGVKLHVSTQAWNEPHDRLSGWFLKRRNERVREGLKRVYDAGVALGVIGMVVGCGGVLWIVCSYASSALGSRRISAPDLGSTDGLQRRDTPIAPLAEARASIPIQMIIPGVTVPIIHTPFILSALFFSQLIHEFGHALTAALESVPLLSVGASFTLILPAAHVALSTPIYGTLSAQAKGRVVSAGPVHNLVMWFVLLGLRKSGLGGVARWVGWENIDGGVVVLGVEPTSPLAPHLTPGITTITSLDDTLLGSTDTWNAYLDSRPNALDKGWCIPKPEFVAPDVCCSPTHSHFSYCFQIHPSPTARTPLGCADPVPILTNATLTRCKNSLDCKSPWKAPKGNEECVVPRSEGLMRVVVKNVAAGVGGEKILLWSGPREEVLEEVRVSTHKPRLRVWGEAQIWIWDALGWIWSYLEMASLSLYFLNLLPIPYLDGMELLRCLRAWVDERRKPRSRGESMEMEEG